MKTILVVDTKASQGLILNLALNKDKEERSYVIHERLDVSDALSFMQDMSLDLLVMNQLPQEDLTALFRYLRKREQKPYVVIRDDNHLDPGRFKYPLSKLGYYHTSNPPKDDVNKPLAFPEYARKFL